MNHHIQLTLEQGEGEGLHPCAVENPRKTFDSPKTYLIIAYCWVEDLLVNS